MRTITSAVGRNVCGLQDRFRLGHLDSPRDWGFARDDVESMWTMPPRDRAEVFVIATGTEHRGRDFRSAASGGQPATSFALHRVSRSSGAAE
jgi:GDPmannose 4,6-dehydratase